MTVLLWSVIRPPCKIVARCATETKLSSDDEALLQVPGTGAISGGDSELGSFASERAAEGHPLANAQFP